MAAQVGKKRLYLDDNGQMITAVASYCLEGASQDDEVADAYLPYAIARYDGERTTLEIVGRMLRPEWEDRFDVGFAAEKS